MFWNLNLFKPNSFEFQKKSLFQLLGVPPKDYRDRIIHQKSNPYMVIHGGGSYYVLKQSLRRVNQKKLRFLTITQYPKTKDHFILKNTHNLTKLNIESDYWTFHRARTSMKRLSRLKVLVIRTNDLALLEGKINNYRKLVSCATHLQSLTFSAPTLSSDGESHYALLKSLNFLTRGLH